MVSRPGNGRKCRGNGRKRPLRNKLFLAGNAGNSPLRRRKNRFRPRARLHALRWPQLRSAGAPLPLRLRFAPTSTGREMQPGWLGFLLSIWGARLSSLPRLQASVSEIPNCPGCCHRYGFASEQMRSHSTRRTIPPPTYFVATQLFALPAKTHGRKPRRKGFARGLPHSRSSVGGSAGFFDGAPFWPTGGWGEKRTPRRIFTSRLSFAPLPKNTVAERSLRIPARHFPEIRAALLDGRCVAQISARCDLSDNEGDTDVENRRDDQHPARP